MKQANLGRISLLVMVLLSVLLVACGGGEVEATATPPPEDTPVVETPETELTAPAATETPEEGEIEPVETAEAEETAPADAGLTAVIASGETAGAGKPFTFDATQSIAGDAAIVNYVWTLGDGTTLFGISVEHAYDEPGFYTVTLIITDENGQTDTAAKVVEIVELAQLATPTAEGDFKLPGTSWELDNAMRGTTVTLTFDDTTLSGFAGCNEYSAAYTTTGGPTADIAIVAVSATGETCSSEVMAQERGFLDSLSVARSVDVDGPTLILSTGQGNLIFSRRVE